jgi:hypothetical protein
MDANTKIDRIVVGLRSGLIVMFNIAFEDDLVVNVEEVELGVRNQYLLMFIVSYKHDNGNKNLQRWVLWTFRWVRQLCSTMERLKEDSFI